MQLQNFGCEMHLEQIQGAETSRIRDVVRGSKILWDAPSKFSHRSDTFFANSHHSVVGLRHHLEYDYHRVGRDFPRVSADGMCNKFIDQPCSKIKQRFKSILPHYSGSPNIEDLWDWIDDIEDYFEETQAPERIKCKLASYALVDEAECWWNQLEHHRFSWWRMKHLIAERFIHTRCLIKYPLEHINGSRCQRQLQPLGPIQGSSGNQYNAGKELHSSGFEHINTRHEDANSVVEVVEAKNHSLTKVPSKEKAEASSVSSNYEHGLDEWHAMQTILSSSIIDAKQKKKDDVCSKTGDECSKENAECNESNVIQTTEAFIPKDTYSIVNAKHGMETDVLKHSRADEYIPTKCSPEFPIEFANNEQFQIEADLDDLKGMTDGKIRPFIVTEELRTKKADEQPVLLCDTLNIEQAFFYEPSPQSTSLHAVNHEPLIQEMINEKLKDTEDFGELGMVAETQCALKDVETLKISHDLQYVEGNAKPAYSVAGVHRNADVSQPKQRTLHTGSRKFEFEQQPVDESLLKSYVDWRASTLKYSIVVLSVEHCAHGKWSMMPLLVELVRAYLAQVNPRTEPAWASLRPKTPTKRSKFVKFGTVRYGTTQFWKFETYIKLVVLLFDPGGSTYLSNTWGFKNYIFSCSNMIDGSIEGSSNSKATLTTYGDDIDSLAVALNASHVFQMNLDIFVDLCKTITFICQKEKSGNIFELLSAIYIPSISKELKISVRSLAFECTVAFILILSLANVGIETMLDIVNILSQLVGQKVELVLVWIYAMVMALEVSAYGFINYGRDEHSRFKTNVVFTSLLGIWNGNGPFKKAGLYHKKLKRFILLERLRVLLGSYNVLMDRCRVAEFFHDAIQVFIKWSDNLFINYLVGQLSNNGMHQLNCGKDLKYMFGTGMILVQDMMEWELHHLDKHFGTVWMVLLFNDVFVSWCNHRTSAGPNLVSGRAIPWEGWNVKNKCNRRLMAKRIVVIISSCLSVLCTNGQSRELLRLFHKVVNGLDPPKGFMASFGDATSVSNGPSEQEQLEDEFLFVWGEMEMM